MIAHGSFFFFALYIFETTIINLKNKSMFTTKTVNNLTWLRSKGFHMTVPFMEIIPVVGSHPSWWILMALYPLLLLVEAQQAFVALLEVV